MRESLDIAFFKSGTNMQNGKRSKKTGVRETPTRHVVIPSVKGVKFESLHLGFDYREEEHEASLYLFGNSNLKNARKESK